MDDQEDQREFFYLLKICAYTDSIDVPDLGRAAMCGSCGTSPIPGQVVDFLKN